jgi:hypothetical protein
VVGTGTDPESQPELESLKDSEKSRTWVDDVRDQPTAAWPIGTNVVVPPQPEGTVERAADLDVPLWLVTGLPDDHRRSAEPGTALHRAALFAMERQDQWSSIDHRDYWETHLALWPRTGRPPLTDATVVPVALAIEQDIAPDEALLAAGVGRNDGRWTELRAAAVEIAAQARVVAMPTILPRVVATEHERAYLQVRGGLLNIRPAHVPSTSLSSSRARTRQVEAALGRTRR